MKRARDQNLWRSLNVASLAVVDHLRKDLALRAAA